MPDLPRLKALALKVTGNEQVTESLNDAQAAELARRLIARLSSFLRDSGQYAYSLDTSPRDPKVDPLEDFLVNRKTGHCEYFASALALMLRSVGVPTRLVSGFKGGTINAISGAYEVEQRHAHVWVEALVEPDRWMTIDPTPAARDVSVASFAAPVKTVHELASVVDATWSQLMNMNINEQQTSLYVPIRDAVQNWWNPKSGERPLLALLYYGLIDFATDPTQWFTLKGIAVAVSLGAIITVLTLLFRMRKRIWRWFLSLWKPRKTAREIRVAFYERFEALCRQLGLVRPSHETQRRVCRVGPQPHSRSGRERRWSARAPAATGRVLLSRAVWRGRSLAVRGRGAGSRSDFPRRGRCAIRAAEPLGTPRMRRAEQLAESIGHARDYTNHLLAATPARSASCGV